MNPAFRFLLTSVSLLSMVDPALADSVGDKAPATDRVILEAGEIGSIAVQVGSYVVVIHGKGERNPVSGEWEQLATSRGYVQAINPETLTLASGRMGKLKSVAFERIQSLVLINRSGGDHALRAGSMKLNQSQTWRPGTKTDKRIARKVGSGAFHGIVIGSLGAMWGGATDGLGQPAVAAFAGLLGYTVGVAWGVSRVDPHDNIAGSLMGSLLGFGTGPVIARVTGSSYFLLFSPVASTALAVWFSEDSRIVGTELTFRSSPLSDFSISLGPGSRKPLSAVASLRF